MNLLDKVGEGLAASVDVLVEKNRQLAQLNRLSAVIKTETDMINRAYIALGKQYFKILEGTAQENDMSQICEVIKFSEERLKKAQARYDYVKVYGVPTSSVDTVDMIRPNEDEDSCEEENCDESDVTAEEISEEDENEDITIAVVEEEIKKAVEETVSEPESAQAEPVKAEETSEPEKTETEETAEDDTAKTIAEKAAETVSYIKKRRSRRPISRNADNETENDG